MLEYQLPSFRYANVFKFVSLIDFIIEVILWIVGAKLQGDELNEIIKFHFTESVFDILVITSFKALLLFVLINELEQTYLVITTYTHSCNPLKREDINIENNNVNVDRETLINSSQADIDKISFPSQYNFRKNILHFLLIFVNIVTFFYAALKFSFVLYNIITNNNNQNENNNMDIFHFSALATELGFCIIQLLFGCFSWIFMRRLCKIAALQRINYDSTQNKPVKRVNLKRLISLSYPERFYILIAFLMLVISSFSNIAVPYFFGLVVDAAQKFTDLSEMTKYVLYMLAVFIVGSIAGGIRSWLFEFSGQRVVARLRQQVFSAIIKQDIKFFDTNRTGELTSRLSSDTQVLQNAVTQNLSILVRYLIQILGSVILMFTLEASLTGVLLAIIPILSILTIQYGRYLRKLKKVFQDELAASSVVAEEAISSVRTVRSFAAEEKLNKEYEKNVQKSFQIGKKLALATGGFMGFVGILTAGALSFVLWYGGKLVHDKKISTGLLASFLMYTLQVAMAFAFLSSLYGDFMQALGASQRIFELLDTQSEIQLDKGFKPQNEIDDLKSFDGSIILNKVDFSYPTRSETKVIKEISFKIEKGCTFALVGPSGGGKSTIFSLLERFYDPNSGEILMGPNNLPLKSVNTKWLHAKIALVSQEPVLFGGTIKENIAFGLEGEVDMEKIIEVSKLANAFEFISTFESGFDTIVGERGIRLSGGQKQRIAIARALLVNPRLLLLDEATSALDSESEHLVQEAIDRAMKDRTVCVIAHRLSTVRNATKVIVLNNGCVEEQGTHDELCARDGIYKRLVLRQLLTKDQVKQEESLNIA